MNGFQSTLALIGRICIAALFLWAAWGKLMGWEGTVAYMASHQMPAIWFFLPAAVFLQVVGSLLVLTGFKARWGAWMLILFIIPAALIFHDYWHLEGKARLTEQIMFMKDVGTLGGLLLLAAFGPGKYAFDR